MAIVAGVGQELGPNEQGRHVGVRTAAIKCLWVG